MEQFNYEQVDLLQDRQVRMYQFSKNSEEYDNTVVQELKPQKYGFEVPSFKDPLKQALEQ